MSYAHVEPRRLERVELRAYLGNRPAVVVGQNNVLRFSGMPQDEPERNDAEEMLPALHFAVAWSVTVGTWRLR